MSQLHIDDIIISYQGQDLSQYGLFPLIAWYLIDVIKLPEYFDQVTVNKKRNRKKSPTFSDRQMCMGLVSLPILGIPRISKINERLSNETQLAKLLGLPKWFDQSTAHKYLNRFSKWHVSQLDCINHQLFQKFGSSTTQSIVIVDIDSQTHTLESRQRENAVVGYNRKKPGKPCYQWNMAFVCDESVSQRLMPGNSHCREPVLQLLEDVKAKLDTALMIIRLDGGFLKGELLNELVDQGLQICMACRYDWVLAQGVILDEAKWQQVDQTTRFYDVGQTKVVSTCDRQFRVVLVEKRQQPFAKSRTKTRIVRYGILENLAFDLASDELFKFYHGRQTIENFFKESIDFQAGKMPSQKFRANEAYLQLVTIAENCMLWLKKTFCLQSGIKIRSTPYETS